jgi:hypothetical protein
MYRLKWKISRLTVRAILRLVAWICNRGEYGWDVWHLLTCLRGFDGLLDKECLAGGISDRDLKELTTGRLRGFLGFRLQRFLVRNSPLLPEEQVRRDQLLNQEATSHFREHYQFAIWAVRDLYGYDLKTEEPWKPAWKS